MRVLALVTDAFGGAGGIAAFNRQFLSALAGRGTEVVALPRLGEAGVVPDGIIQHPPNPGRVGYTAALAQLLATDRAFDLVWCGHIRVAPLAAIAARILDRPMWLHIHGIDAWDRPGRAIRTAAMRAKTVSAVSRYTRRRFLSWASLPPERIRVLPNCVDAKFTPGPKRSDLIKRYRLEGKRVMLTIARLSREEGYKGHDRVLRVLSRLAAQYPDLVYVIGGDGDDRPRLEALACELGVMGRCRFIGRLPEAEIVDHHRLADVFVMPSTGEGFGIVYLEAMACGVPAVGLDVDGSVDPLRACSLGQAVPESSLADTIAALLRDPPARPDAVPQDLAPFSREAFAASTQELLGQIVGDIGVRAPRNS